MQILISLVLAFVWAPGVAFALVLLLSALTAGWNTLPLVSVIVSLTALSLVAPLLFLAKRNGGVINFSLVKPLFVGLPVALLAPVFLARWASETGDPLGVAPVTVTELASPFEAGAASGSPFGVAGVQMSEFIIQMVTVLPVLASVMLVVWAGCTWWGSRPSIEAE